MTPAGHGAHLRRPAHRVHRLDRGGGPSDPNVVYVGSGEGLHRPDLSTGDGIYKSPTPVRSWTRLGLNDAQQIRASTSTRATQPLVRGALAIRTVPTRSAAIFRVARRRQDVPEGALQGRETRAGNDVDIDRPTRTWCTHAVGREQGPWENAVLGRDHGGISSRLMAEAPGNRSPTGSRPSCRLTSPSRLPDHRRLYAARVAFADQPGSSGNRGTTASSSSDDAGTVVDAHHDRLETIRADWRGRPARADSPSEARGHRDHGGHRVVEDDRRGKTWSVYKGAPGGEDYQHGWINPDNPDIILLWRPDTGAVRDAQRRRDDGVPGTTQSDRTALCTLPPDNAFPISRVQRTAGERIVLQWRSRGNSGRSRFVLASPVGVDEYASVAPDPLNPQSSTAGRTVSRFDRRTGQVSTRPSGRGGGAAQPAGAVDPVARCRWSSPKSTRSPLLRRTTTVEDDGRGPLDGITRTHAARRGRRRRVSAVPQDPACEAQPRGVIYTIAPSYQDVRRIWVRHRRQGSFTSTRDGGSPGRM